MSDDRLNLVARVEDHFTGPLGKLKRDLNEVSDATKRNAGNWRKDWDGAREGVTRFEGALNSVSPVLSRLGVTGIGAALSLGGVAVALGDFSLKTRGLSQTSKDIGLTVDQLRAFNALGERFGVTADTMTGAAKSFAAQMFEIKRQGSTYVELQAMNLGKLAQDLASAKTLDQAIERGMEGLRKIPDAEVRRRVSRLLFGTDDIGLVATNLTGTVKGALGEVSTAIGKMDQETEQAAKNFQGHLSRISEAAEKLKIKTIGPLLKGIVGLIDDYETNGLSGPQMDPALRDRLKDIGGSGPTARDRLEGRRSSVQQQLDLLDKNPDAPDYRRKRDRMVEELERVADELERLRQQGGATLSPSSFGGQPGAGGGSLIQKAAWGSGGFGGFGGGAGGGFGAGGGGPLGGYGGGTGGGFGGIPGGHGAAAGSPAAGSPAGVGAGQSGVRPGAPGPLAGAGAPDAGAPRGNGRGNPRAARTGDMMAWAMDQLRREGVPEQHLRQAAAHLVGQAHMESGLDPNKVHDQGTGYGIYGARDPKGWGNYKGARRSHMIRWLEANGYARNSAEGQMRYMAREAMTGGYGRTRRILMGEGSGNVEADTNTITREFEAPAIINRRSPAVQNAYRTGPSDDAVRTDMVGSSDGADVPWYQRPRSNEPGKMSRLRDDELEVPGLGQRPGDRMMRRFYGEGAPVAKGGKGSLHITLDGFPPGAKARATMDDLFSDTKVERARSQMDMI